jgi:hypothetical protein
MKSSDSCQFPEVKNASDAPRRKEHVTESIRVINATPPYYVYHVGHRGWRNYLRAPSAAITAVDKGATEDDHVRRVSTESQTAPTKFRTV